MFYFSITAFILIATLFESSYQQQNLCGTNPNVTFVSDASTCHTYLRCLSRDSNGFVTRFTIGSCYLLYESGTNMFRNGACHFTTLHCENPLLMCPPDGEPDIMVADPLDRECRRHRPCRGLNQPYATCHESLRFNRNTGMCDLPENAPCDAVLLPPMCPSGYTGFFRSTRCYQYIYCQDGQILLNLECQDGMYYNHDTQSCLFDTNNSCPRTTTAIDSSQINPENIENYF